MLGSALAKTHLMLCVLINLYLPGTSAGGRSITCLKWKFAKKIMQIISITNFGRI